MSYSIKDMLFPLYYIGEHDRVYSEFNVTYVENKGKTLILDNKNLDGLTLGARRLKLPSKELYQFRKTIFMFSELIEFTRNKPVANRKFMDSTGKIFTYIKKEYKPLLHLEISKVDIIPNFALISVIGSPQIFRLPSNYYSNIYYYVTVLDMGSYYCLYDLSVEKPTSKRRKV